MKLTSGSASLRAAIVDLDGTMVDTLGDFEVALNQMLGDLRLPGIDRDTIQRMVGKGSEHLVQSVLTHVGAPSNCYPAAWEAYQRHYLAVNGRHADVYPGVVEGLSGLQSRGIKLACLTNKPTDFALPLLASKGLSRYFSVVFGGDAFEHKKPHPMPLLKTCQALSSLPAETLMIGDSSNDAAAARAAGCRVVLVTYGYNHGEPVRSVDADGFVDSLADLGSLL
jgi:phosphoglycolate phosphatase